MKYSFKVGDIVMMKPIDEVDKIENYGTYLIYVNRWWPEFGSCEVGKILETGGINSLVDWGGKIGDNWIYNCYLVTEEQYPRDDIKIECNVNYDDLF